MKKVMLLISCVTAVSSLIAGCSASNPGGLFRIPNPVVQYDSQKEAEKAAGFEIQYAGDLKVTRFDVIAGNMLDFDFSGGYFRKTSKTADDISGDYNPYPVTKEKTFGEIRYTYKGDGTWVHIACWTDNGFSYCINFINGVAETKMDEFVQSIR